MGNLSSVPSPVTVFSTFAVCMVGMWYLFRRKGQLELIKRQPGEFEKPIRYNLTNEALPAFSGLKMRLISYLYSSNIGSWLLIPESIKIGMFTLMERLVLDEVPTYQPLIQFDGPVSDGSSVDVEHLILKEPPQETDAFRFTSISDYYRKYRSGELTPSDVAENVIRAIHDSEEQDPKLRAMVQWDEEEIRQMAAESTKRFKRRGTPLSVMDGVPVCVKEELDCPPYIFRVGTKFRSQMCSEDATVIAKLRAGGAVIIGMANMHELGMGTTGNNPSRLHETPRNPYNVEHYTGGSSSGSAVAVAAGLCPVGLGTDGGGSIRIPAALCGLTGLKGTFGRFSGAGCAPLAFTVTHLGPLCATVRDNAIMYGMLAGPDPRDCNTKWQPPVTLEGFEDTDLKGIKIGIYQPYSEHADPEIVATCEKAVQFLQHQGAKKVDIEIAELQEIRVAQTTAILAEFRAALKGDFTDHLRELSSENAMLLSVTSQFSATMYVTACKQRTRTINYLKNHVFNKVDVIITPATAITAPPIQPSDLKYGFTNTSMTLDIMRYVCLGNLTGIPCLTVTVGYDKQGLPIGLQIMGRWWEDHVILRVGNVVEKMLENNIRKPQVYYDNLQ